ncbi:TIGR03089 family protein [Mangrovihabitans endophyticus]|uniref:Acyl-CoA synthetase n=1 Tax=Mangrovihabitans endophyticus TaxID=1751298 RepID=A0A8J3FMT6_9ACTN|nr:TIGR03089 family protein [Mangrovihabitans endophyticus]GGK85878.1 acyl-CoA synthetase [Mangrovihabitans endophyticus]
MLTTIPAAVRSAVARDPAAPLLTWYDDASGDRTELSGATMDNWVAKTANMLVDGLGTEPGDTVALRLPAHWQTAAILLGASAAGLIVDLGTEPRPATVLFTDPPHASVAASGTAGDSFVTGLLPLAMPVREVPAGFADYVTEVRVHGDHFQPGMPVSADDPALLGPGVTGATPLRHGAVCDAARRRAADLGISAGDRVLLSTRAHPDPMDWLLAPLVAGASTVLCANLDGAAVTARAESEKVTVTLV